MLKDIELKSTHVWIAILLISLPAITLCLSIQHVTLLVELAQLGEMIHSTYSIQIQENADLVELQQEAKIVDGQEILIHGVIVTDPVSHQPFYWHILESGNLILPVPKEEESQWQYIASCQRSEAVTIKVTDNGKIVFE